MHNVIKIVWTLVIIAGPKDQFSNIASWQFKTKQACFSMMQSLQKQRPDIAANCTPDQETSWEYDEPRSTQTFVIEGRK